MLKPVAAGLMCLGLATLGVAVTRGQDSKKPEPGESEVIGNVATVVVQGDVKVAEGQPVEAGTAGVVVSGKGELEIIDVGQDDGVGDSKLNVYRVESDGQNVVFYSDDGKTVEKVHVGATPRAARIALQTAARGPLAVDPETRATLEKLTAGLREDAKRLESEGKRDEAGQKAQSIQAIERLLAGRPFGLTGGRVAHLTGPGPNSEELMKLRARRDDLTRQLATKADANDEAAAKIKQELVDLEDAIRQHLRLFEARAVLGVPRTTSIVPVAPGMLSRVAAGAGVRFRVGQARSEALSRQSEALSQAAAKLQEAGLGEQAKQLAEQAEKLKDQAQQIAKEEAERMHAQGAGGFGGGGIAVFGGGPPMELQRSIKELHEQVQLLRKEVAELREVLQLKR